MEARRYPFDFDDLALEKGSVITNAEIAEATGTQESDHAAFQLVKLGIKAQVDDWFRGRGEIVFVRALRDGVRVLTDAEAAEFGPAAFIRAMRKAGDTHIRSAAIDTNKLTDAERRELEHRVIAQSAMLQAAKAAQRQARKLIRRGDDETGAIAG